MESYALPDAKAETVAGKLVSEFVCRFGVPLELHSDQGTNFESAVFSEMCRALGISKTRTTAYNPKSDGMVERFNKTLINMVAVMIEPRRRQRDWDECLPYACFAYRCTPQRVNWRVSKYDDVWARIEVASGFGSRRSGS